MFNIKECNNDLIIITEEYYDTYAHKALQKILKKYYIIEYCAYITEKTDNIWKKAVAIVNGNSFHEFRNTIATYSREIYNIEVKILLIKK